MFASVKTIDETAHVVAICDPFRNRDVVILVEFDDDDNLMLTNADDLTELDACDAEYLRSFFADEYAAEYKR